jgi:hypothetical protein
VTDSDKRRLLLDFLNERVFKPVLDSTPAAGVDGAFLRDAQKAVRRTWMRYPNYPTADSIKQAFFSDIKSPVGQRLAALLEWLQLPRFEDIEKEFSELCKRLGV